LCSTRGKLISLRGGRGTSVIMFNAGAVNRLMHELWSLSTGWHSKKLQNQGLISSIMFVISHETPGYSLLSESATSRLHRARPKITCFAHLSASS